MWQQSHRFHQNKINSISCAFTQYTMRGEKTWNAKYILLCFGVRICSDNLLSYFLWFVSASSWRIRNSFQNLWVKCCLGYLDFDLVESFSVVNSDDGSDHLRNDNHVAQMCLYHLNKIQLVLIDILSYVTRNCKWSCECRERYIGSCLQRVKRKLLVKSGCSFLTLQWMILMQWNLLAITEIVVSGTQCIS